MKRGSVWIPVVLLTVVFVWSALRQFGRGDGLIRDGRTTIRFAHTQLEPGVREAYEGVIAAYEALHPDVRVEQIAVPLRAWPAWMRTRLVGGTAPDLLQLITNDPNPIQRYYQPISKWMVAPNPYNAGTDLADVTWKETFVVPAEYPPAYWPIFLEYYGVPQTFFTFRVFYNRTLWREVVGNDKVPTTYSDFINTSRIIRSEAEQRGLNIQPMAGSRFNAPFVLNALFGAVAQSYVDTLDFSASFGLDFNAATSAYARGVWSVRDPAFQAGLELMQEVGEVFQPGFLQANRDEAMFLFAQERALMFVSGSWEYGAIKNNVPFEIGVFHLPTPGPEHPKYGRFVLGENSEASTSYRAAFALTKQSQSPDIAMDFLQFLTSRKIHKQFTRSSGWLPIVQGVAPPPGLAVFMPRMHGYPQGTHPGIGIEVDRFWATRIFDLFTPGGVEKISTALERVYPELMELSVDKEAREIPRAINQLEKVILAVDLAPGAQPNLVEKRSEAIEAQTQLELNLAVYDLDRARLRKLPRP